MTAAKITNRVESAANEATVAVSAVLAMLKKQFMREIEQVVYKAVDEATKGAREAEYVRLHRFLGCSSEAAAKRLKRDPGLAKIAMRMGGRWVFQRAALESYMREHVDRTDGRKRAGGYRDAMKQVGKSGRGDDAIRIASRHNASTNRVEDELLELIDQQRRDR